MAAKITGTGDQQMPSWALGPFLAISFGISWGILALYLFASDWANARLGPLSGQHPLFYLAVYAPALAAMILALGLGGRRGLLGLLRRCLLWRASTGWMLFLVFGLPAVFFGGAALLGNPLAAAIRSTVEAGLIPALFFMAVKGPVEELGWRGFALPLLQRGLAPLWAGLVLGAIWGLWHGPAFLLSGAPQSAWDFTPFLIGTVAISVLMTGLFNASRGSVLLCAGFHFQLINPLWPEAQPWDSWLLAAAAVVLVLVRRRAMLARGDAVTSVWD